MLSRCGSRFVPDGTSIARGDENDTDEEVGEEEEEEEEEEDTKDALLRCCRKLARPLLTALAR